MNTLDRKKHWETVYNTKMPHQVSWTQDIPTTSLSFIQSLNLTKDARIIDVGGGDSKLVDFLLQSGFKNITVLDISEKALERAQNRLGGDAKKVNWIVSDITTFKPNTTFDVWHDRATFHFLTDKEQIAQYTSIVQKAVNQFLILGTFSVNGPTKCSGLDIQQYSEQTLTEAFKNEFEKLQCITENHTTPFNTIQNFLFCSFKRCVNKNNKD